MGWPADDHPAFAGLPGRKTPEQMSKALRDYHDRQDKAAARAAATPGRARDTSPRMQVEETVRTDLNRSSGPRPVLIVRQISHLEPNISIDINVFDENYLVTDLQLANPEQYRRSAAIAAPPTMFVNGALPAFTNSGIAPEKLLRLPWILRHEAAVLDGKDFSNLFEACGTGDQRAWLQARLWLTTREQRGQPTAEGHDAYWDRVETWAHPYLYDTAGTGAGKITLRTGGA